MEYKKDKRWKEIDRIVDEEYGWHYVVPSKPGEVDTTPISNYIQILKKERKEREENGR
ncbi:hypothetical protein [Neobacillus sp. PS3-40]|uniref:hypothetical protein n=1 Tax=Neobacillus sp. PS3-40 TaxID=3070679 RepID=UPI0027DFFE69|nr:hypothetical protein [Neobacillus sp. PS3-40]WML43123.1 hypothetical protein RCG20_15110 [Neobacillus sp. PS3-40]